MSVEKSFYRLLVFLLLGNTWTACSKRSEENSESKGITDRLLTLSGNDYCAKSDGKYIIEDLGGYASQTKSIGMFFTTKVAGLENQSECAIWTMKNPKSFASCQKIFLPKSGDYFKCVNGANESFLRFEADGSLRELDSESTKQTEGNDIQNEFDCGKGGEKPKRLNSLKADSFRPAFQSAACVIYKPVNFYKVSACKGITTDSTIVSNSSTKSRISCIRDFGENEITVEHTYANSKLEHYSTNASWSPDQVGRTSP